MKTLKIGDLTAKYPIIQGGMGCWYRLQFLAGAVAKAGGIGIISTAQIGFKDPEFFESTDGSKSACHWRRIEKSTGDRAERYHWI